MMTIPQRLTAAFALLIFATSASGQIALLERGPADEKLDFLIGRWAAESSRLQPVKTEAESEVTYIWKYGGVYLEAYDPTPVEGTGMIHNVMLMVWDPSAGVYSGIWIDNVSPAMIRFQARWTDDRTLVLDTGDIEISGRRHRATEAYTRMSDTRLRKELRWSWDGGELELVATTELRKLAKHE